MATQDPSHLVSQKGYIEAFKIHVLPYYPIILPGRIDELYEKSCNDTSSPEETRLLCFVIRLGVLVLNFPPSLPPDKDAIFTRSFRAELELFDQKSESITLVQSLLLAALVAIQEARESLGHLQRARRFLHILCQKSETSSQNQDINLTKLALADLLSRWKIPVEYEIEPFPSGFFLNTFGTNLMDIKWLQIMGSSRSCELSCTTLDVKKRIQTYLEVREHEKNIHIHRRPGMTSLMTCTEHSDIIQQRDATVIIPDILGFLTNAAILHPFERHATFKTEVNFLMHLYKACRMGMIEDEICMELTKGLFEFLRRFQDRNDREFKGWIALLELASERYKTKGPLINGLDPVIVAMGIITD